MPLAVAANEIIIGGLSHSSSTAAWQSAMVVRWCGGDDGGSGGGGGGGYIPSLGDRRRRGCERVTGSAAYGRARAREDVEDEEVGRAVGRER